MIGQVAGRGYRMTVTAISSLARKHLEGRLPGWVEPRWFDTVDDLLTIAPEAEIGWFDGVGFATTTEVSKIATRLKWLNTFAAGVEIWPLDLLRERGVTFTNGAGVNDIAVAEYAVLGMLVIAKGYRDVVRAQDRGEWLHDAPGKIELHGTRALIVGSGAIGRRVADMLGPFHVQVTEVRRRPAPQVLTPDEWRAQLGKFDWVIVSVPATPDTERMFGQAEFAAMKPGSAILNFSRGSVIDQQALAAAMQTGQLGGAFLDVTDPEPLPPDDPLWTIDNVHITSHLSGRSQTALFRRASERFLENLLRWERGEELLGLVDLEHGY